MDAYACPRGGWYGFVLAVGRALLPLVPYLGPAIEALLKFQEDRAFNEAIGRMLLPASGVGPAAAAPWNVRRPHLESAVRQAVQHLSPRDRENVRRLLERVSPQAGREELL
ncbi:MAG: hypothetical protein HYZ53_08915, partial [Planctomycetes bacterium]|nr:hypothetical protein [Planctomycetota bacterium]